MKTKIFINLPVKDLNKSIEFFGKLGFSFNPQFTDDNASCMVISDEIFVMLLVEKFFKTFTTKEICDATKTTEVLVALSVESRLEVDEMSAKALASGATTPMPAQDHGWMYQKSFQDLDGHVWEIIYMDPAAQQ